MLSHGAIMRSSRAFAAAAARVASLVANRGRRNAERLAACAVNLSQGQQDDLPCLSGRRPGSSNFSLNGAEILQHFGTYSLFHPSLSTMHGHRAQTLRGVAQATQAPATACEPQDKFRVHDAHPTLPKSFHNSADKINLKAQVVFEACWRKLEEKYKDRYQCPREIVWLNGAPGAGKGANTPYILEIRGMTRAVPMSSLLQRDPAIMEVMNRGELVPDTMVGDALLDVIFDPEESDGAGLVLDGFPRTALQVDFLKLLYDKMMALHHQHADGPDEVRFPRPSFKVVVLYVEMEESVRRQMQRAKLASLHNKRAMDAGTEDLWELRATDIDVKKCRRRYEVFRAHYSTLLRLKQYFPFSLIDAMGSLEDTRAQIARELRYQSSLDLGEATYAAIRHIPLAKELVRMSRQQLVQRLDGYCKRTNNIFQQVVKAIDREVVPQLKRCSLAGHAEFKTHNPLFVQHPIACDILIDVLSDRGFSVAHVVDEQVIPQRVDLETGEVINRVDVIHHFRITFEKQELREVVQPGAAREAQEHAKHAAVSAAIGQTFVPSHLDRDRLRTPPTLPLPSILQNPAPLHAPLGSHALTLALGEHGHAAAAVGQEVATGVSGNATETEEKLALELAAHGGGGLSGCMQKDLAGPGKGRRDAQVGYEMVDLDVVSKTRES